MKDGESNYTQLSQTNSIKYLKQTPMYVNAITDGIIIALNNEDKTMTNTRPITLLFAQRKFLSNILLEHIIPHYQFLLQSQQSANRPKRSFSETNNHMVIYYMASSSCQTISDNF